MTAARLARAVLTGLLGTLTGLAFGPVFGGLPGPGAFVVAVAVTTGAATLVVLAAVLFPRLSPTLIALAGAAVVVVTAAGVTGSGPALVDGDGVGVGSSARAGPAVMTDTTSRAATAVTRRVRRDTVSSGGQRDVGPDCAASRSGKRVTTG